MDSGPRDFASGWWPLVHVYLYTLELWICEYSRTRFGTLEGYALLVHWIGTATAIHNRIDE
jgi:hypothetical protein